MHFELPHLGISAGGYVAVDLFFVLSGYVINSAYGSRLTDGPQILRFTIRRFGRLWPTYIATTILFYLLLTLLQAIPSIASHSPIRIVHPSAVETLGIVVMSQGLGMFDHYVGNAVSWSISDEFYAYLIFGAVGLLANRLMRLVAFSLLAATGYVIALYVTVVTNHCGTNGLCFDLTFDYGWARCMAGFFVGALLAEYRSENKMLLALAKSQIQIAVFVFSTAFIAGISVFPVLATGAPVVFLVLVATLRCDSGPVAHLFQTRAFQYLGAISYSLYLAHGVLRQLLALGGMLAVSPVQQGIVGALFLTMSFVLANFLHQKIEIPFRARFYRWSDEVCIPSWSSGGKRAAD
jgi:peptidoglycan/LPS O-acetylase OafA/YrhL